jgi:AbrB family looped-hinge helix DNA binding protein
MRQATISSGGQVSIPADIRRRWGTTRLSVEDRGDALVLRPIPPDPIAAAVGSLAGPGPSSDASRARVREEERTASDRRARRDRHP